MAFFPCDVGPHANPRRNINCYVGIAMTDGMERYSTRLCELHWRQIEPHWAEYEVVTDGTAAPFDYSTFICPSCKKPVDQLGVRAFLTAYPTKNDRKDYWLNVHTDCSLPPWLPKQPPARLG